MRLIFAHHPKPPPWPVIRQAVRRRWTIPFHYAEWCGDNIAHALSSWSLLAVLEYLGTLSVLLAVVSYFAESHGRIEQKHYQAWQVINTAQGKGGSGGRIEALQNLNEDRVPLVGVDLSGAFLQGLKLPHAQLQRSTIRGTDLRDAYLAGANFENSALAWTNFEHADLHAAILAGTDLQDADLSGADLSQAAIGGADLSRADLHGANLQDLRDWNHITAIRQANLANIKNPPPGFLDWAIAHGAITQPADPPTR